MLLRSVVFLAVIIISFYSYVEISATVVDSLIRNSPGTVYVLYGLFFDAMGFTFLISEWSIAIKSPSEHKKKLIESLTYQIEIERSDSLQRALSETIKKTDLQIYMQSRKGAIFVAAFFIVGGYMLQMVGAIIQVQPEFFREDLVALIAIGLVFVGGFIWVLVLSHFIAQNYYSPRRN